MFEDTQRFNDIFKHPPLDGTYFQFIFSKLLVDEILKEKKFKKLKGRNYIVATVNAIFWDVIKHLSPTKFQNLKYIANQELTLFAFKDHAELFPLRDVVDFIIKKAKKIGIREGFGMKKALQAFVDGSTADNVNEEIFELCQNDSGTRRKLKTKIRIHGRVTTRSSRGVYTDIEEILLEHIDNWEECGNLSCKLLTDKRKLETDGCIHCQFGSCPNCNKLTDFEENSCGFCQEELPLILLS